MRPANLSPLFWCLQYVTVLEIFGYSALFCIPVLVPIAARSRNNEAVFALDPNQTYEGFDNLAMGNVEVNALTIISCDLLVWGHSSCISMLIMLELVMPGRNCEALGVSCWHLLGIICDILCSGQALQEDDSLAGEGASTWEGCSPTILLSDSWHSSSAEGYDQTRASERLLQKNSSRYLHELFNCL